MRRPLPLTLALIVAAGCSGDPATSRLKIGVEAIVRAPEPAPKRPPMPTMSDGKGGRTTEAELYTQSPNPTLMPSVLVHRASNGRNSIALQSPLEEQPAHVGQD